jgi:hypothetical protein
MAGRPYWNFKAYRGSKMSRAIIPSEKVGLKFGRLTVVEAVERVGNEPLRFRCKCDCGRVGAARYNSLITGNTSSCGCKSQYRVSLKKKGAASLLW